MQALANIAADLASSGLAVADDFLDATACQEVARELRALYTAGTFHLAGIGRSSDFRVAPAVRSDTVLWLDPPDLSPPLAAVWHRLEGLRTALNRSLYLGLTSLEIHAAVYPPGAFYHKHLDAFAHGATGPARLVSTVLYLNDAWQTHDGGMLRVYDPAAPDRVWRDIAPLGGRLVCFLSQDIYHEVLTAHRERLSLTGWFRR